MNNHIKDALWGAGVASLMLLPVATWMINQPPDPYSKVEVQRVTELDDGFLFNVTFRKNDCQFRSLRAYQTSFGIWEQAEWTDVAGEQGDRPFGEQELNLKVTTDPLASAIEFRTIHSCPPNGELVSKVFFHYDITGDR